MNKNSFIRSLFCYMSDEAGAEGGAGAAATTTEATTTEATPTTTTEATPDFYNTLPEAYRDKEYFKALKSQDDLLEQFDNAQKLIGKKAVPDETSTPEQWEEFYAKLRPASADEYAIPDPEYPDEQTKALLENSRSPELMAQMKSVFHKAGLTKQQAATVVSEYEKAQMQMFKPLFESIISEQEALNKDFDVVGKEVFGDKFDAAIETGRKLYEQFADPKLKDALKDAPNKVLIGLAGVLNKINDTFIKEGGVIGDSGLGHMSEAELRARMQDNYTKLYKMNPLDAEYQRLSEDNQTIAKQLAEAKKSQR